MIDYKKVSRVFPSHVANNLEAYDELFVPRTLTSYPAKYVQRIKKKVACIKHELLLY